MIDYQVPSDAPPLRANELAALHKDGWQAMSPEQKVAETEEDLEELKQLKITHKYAPHNTARGTLNDTQASLRRVEKEVSIHYGRASAISR